jgi:hypothetical protein
LEKWCGPSKLTNSKRKKKQHIENDPEGADPYWKKIKKFYKIGVYNSWLNASSRPTQSNNHF